MSAFIVEDKTINSVLAFLKRLDHRSEVRATITRETQCYLDTEEGREKLGQAMFDLNCAGVDARYGEGESVKMSGGEQYQYTSDIPPTPIQAYKSLRCFLYQCSEGDIPETSLLHATLDRVSAELAHQIVCDLPEYDSSEWG